MKKNTIILMVSAIAFIIAALSFNSCTKQEGANKNTQDVALSDKNIAFIDKLVDFKQKVEYVKNNPELKSGEVVSTDEAIWGMEALFNVTFGFAGENYRATKTDTSKIYINVDNNGEVLLDDIVAKYDEITNVVTGFYHNSGFDDKGLILLDLKKGDIANDQMEIEVRSVTGEKDPPPPYDPFGENIEWYYGNNKGDCDWNNGPDDAAERIEYFVMGNRHFHQPEPWGPPGYHLVYEVDEIKLRTGAEYTDENGDNLIFFIQNSNGVFTDEERCLNSDELNFHFHGEETVIYDIIPFEEGNNPDWIFMSCDLEGQDYSDFINSIYQIRHYNTLTYGFRYLVPDDVIDPPIEL